VTAETPQHLQALERANQVRLSGSIQRASLAAAPLQTLIPALVDPTPELGHYTLGALFASRSSCVKRLVPGVGISRLSRVLVRLEAERPLGRQWHVGLKLGELTTGERRRLVTQLLSKMAKGPSVCEGLSAEEIPARTYTQTPVKDHKREVDAAA
jgi:hypothetical protein